MKESEAIQYLRNALVIAQKTRSIHAEAYSEVSERVRVFFEPKTQRPEWLLKPLLKILDQVDQGAPLKPMDFFNIMTVIQRFAPKLQIEAALLELPEFPEPDIF